MGKRTTTARWNENKLMWRIDVQNDGIRKSFYSSTPGRTGQREANAKADAWLDGGITTPNARITTIGKDYLSDVKNRTSACNYRLVEYIWRLYIDPVVGTTKICDINDNKLQNAINIAYKKGLSKKTLKTIRSTMSAFFKFCRKGRYTMYAPEDIVIPNGAPTSEKNILQPNDLRILFSRDTTILHCQKQYDNFIHAYRFQVLTGLRPGELLGLMPNDIVGDQVYIRRSINAMGEITTGKNDNAHRSFVLSAQAKTELDAQRSEYQGLYVFGNITSQDSYHNRWRKFCEANEITTHTTPYGLRHTFVSVAKLLPEGEVKPLVGHSRNMDTFGVYGHELSGEKEIVAAKINDAFSAIIATTSTKKSSSDR